MAVGGGLWLLDRGIVVHSDRGATAFQGQLSLSPLLWRFATAIKSCKPASKVSASSTQTQENNDVDIARAETFLQDFEAVWNTKSSKEIVEQSFVATTSDNPTAVPFWRDMVAFTWNICTNEGTHAIQQALQETNRPRTSWSLSSKPLPIQKNNAGFLEFWCDLQIDERGSGKAHIRLNNQDKIQTLLTTLLELEKRPFQVGPNRIRGQIHGPTPKRKYWPERLRDQQQLDDNDGDNATFVAIVGGGQAGLALGARLQFMNIPYTIIEAGAQPGTAWRNRYPSLHLHDPVWYQHMPYLPFPETWPILCPRDKIADFLESYAKILDLNVQARSRVTKVVRPYSSNQQWELQIEQQQQQESDSSIHHKTTVRARHVVFATGNSSKPRIPKLPGKFNGRQLHSSQYRGGRPFANQRVVVVGSNNSAFDIVQDLWEQGAQSVTMIQRTPSMVVSTDSVLTHGLGPLYRENAPLHHEEADLVATATPYKLMQSRWKAVTKVMQENDKDLLEGLEKAGYQLEQGPDGTGIFAKSATEGGGFYINMGCAELLIRGDVTVRYATVSRLEEDQVIIQAKTSKEEEALPADVIVYATGFDTMDQWVAQLCGEDVAKKVGRTWGLGLGKRPKDPGPWEGELRNMWKPTTVEGLWFHGGNLAQSRHYSRFLALQLAARYLALEIPVYGVPEPTEPARSMK